VLPAAVVAEGQNKYRFLILQLQTFGVSVPGGFLFAAPSLQNTTKNVVYGNLGGSTHEG
jgi:hypothetical protein